MANYVDRTELKTALGIPATTTGDHLTLDRVAESVSRRFDRHVGFPFAPTYQARDFTAKHTQRLMLDVPLLAVESIRTSSDGGSTYGTTLAATDYYLAPYNASMESPPRPYWEIESTPNATAGLVTHQRGVRITGTWGYYDQRRPSSATLATAIATGTTTIELNFATAVHVGQLLLMGGERMQVTRTPGSASGVHTSTVDVLRGQNGTSGVAHSCGTGIEVYEYPTVGAAALYQAQMDYRALDAPLGTAGGQPFGEQRVNAPGGLHPFVERDLEQFRKPTAG